MLFPSIFRDDLFNDFFDMPRQAEADVRHLLGKSTNGLMRTDVKEKDGKYELKVDLPGFDKGDVTAEIKDGYLTITATKAENNDEKDEDGKYIRRERYEGTMSRSYYVGDAVTENDIKAKFDKSILTVEIPKKEPEEVKEEKHLIAIEG